jgi:hypothetical protein
LIPRAASSSPTASQIVGTPPAIVTRSPVIRSTIEAASRCLPVKTCFAPAIVAACGIPQAFAWNIGTIGRTHSRGPIPTPAAEVAANECSTVERCVYTAPFGRPVVPDV